MTIHVNIGEAKTRLSALIAAALRGEEVVLAKAGEPQVRLVPIDPDSHRQVVADRRASFIGSLKGRIADVNWFAQMPAPELAGWQDGAIDPASDDEPAA